MPAHSRNVLGMAKNQKIDQHIAVFGESGSGKTVLVSSFYGAAHDSRPESLYRIIPGDMGEGVKLYQNYLGMRDSARTPELTKFNSDSYTFSVKMKEASGGQEAKTDLRLIWHDYPGEWFEQETTGPTEAKRRIDTFQSLLGSDIALFLVDSQRLLDNSEEEERYLKSVFINFGNGLLSLKDDLLPEGEKLGRFPRIWVIALSKADLLPDMDVVKFRDLVIGKAGRELADLGNVLKEFVEGEEALSLGEDFVLLSSAKFETGKIEVEKRIGVDLILPIASMLPLERYAKWSQASLLPGKIAEKLLNVGNLGVGGLAAAMVGNQKLFGKVALIQAIVSLMSKDVVNEAVKLVGEKLREANEEALAKHNYLQAMLTGFKIDLEKAEAEKVFLRSPK